MSKCKRSGTQYSKDIRIVNNNPILKKVKSNFIKDLQDLREEILNKWLEEIDIVKDKAERRLIYDASSMMGAFKGLAKNKPEKYIKLLRTAIILDEEGNGHVVERFIKIRNSVADKVFPNILRRAAPLKVTSIVQTIYKFHDNILNINMNVLKHLLYDELDSTCLEYIKSYEVTDTKKLKEYLDKFEDIIEEPLLDFEEIEKTKEIEEIEEIEEINITREFKMRSFKELNDLATKNGFNFIRQRGDHAIFRNEKGYITVIPQRTVGKGLQIEILKQIGEY